MARNPYANTQMQNFWKETIEKEASARLLSFAKLKGQPQSTARQLEVFRKKIEDNKPSGELRQHLPTISAHHSRKKTDVSENETRDLDRAKMDILSDVPEMRPVTPMVKNILYDGFTKEGRGRHLYLQHRKDKNPEDKYSFPTCTSWEYGWRLNDVVKKDDIRKPKHGRYRIVENTFYSRNGLMNSCNRVH